MVQKTLDHDVIQIGHGPVSKALALFLQRLGWKVGVFERLAEVDPLPRAWVMWRRPCVPVYRRFDAAWTQLLAIERAAGSVSGGAEVNFIHQPTFERGMDARVKAAGIDLAFRSECVGVRQAEDHAAKNAIGIDGPGSGPAGRWPIGQSAAADDRRSGRHRRTGRVNRRWELTRPPHEIPAAMNEEAKVWALLSAWVKPDQGERVRHRVQTFRSMVAERFQGGGVFLAGDAAHVMPPVMGQGICDVWNLAGELGPHGTVRFGARPRGMTACAGGGPWRLGCLCAGGRQGGHRRGDRHRRDGPSGRNPGQGQPVEPEPCRRGGQSTDPGRRGRSDVGRVDRRHDQSGGRSMRAERGPCIWTDRPRDGHFFGRGGDPATGFTWTSHFFWSAAAVRRQGPSWSMRAFIRRWPMTSWPRLRR